MRIVVAQEKTITYLHIKTQSAHHHISRIIPERLKTYHLPQETPQKPSRNPVLNEMPSPYPIH